jgi:hypothetical protein
VAGRLTAAQALGGGSAARADAASNGAASNIQRRCLSFRTRSQPVRDKAATVPSRRPVRGP